ncbi:cell division protein ZipA [Candidatus Nitrosacidococcus tergens]|uniref:Cell division protein ZipA n=1 Tax=Candidatus Nitrosacidococcus tergens TaxID=553981 RepID=A0A7G1QAG4_9GAMM|nr:cell division protein ZipA [Candidatus Nitrosacidococcus tergens]CAB1276017.1 putative Cell division protein ZipA [Candidatus Nitrosacidococcus tergens]
MNNLRLTLFIISILLLVLIYFYSRWELKKKGAISSEQKVTDDDHQKDIVDTHKEDLDLAETTAESSTSYQEKDSFTSHPTTLNDGVDTSSTIQFRRNQEVKKDQISSVSLDESYEVEDPFNEKTPPYSQEKSRYSTFSTDEIKGNKYSLEDRQKESALPSSQDIRSKSPAYSPKPPFKPQSSFIESPTKKQPTTELGPELIIALTVTARGKGVFQGRDIASIFIEHGLQFGEMSIFHAYARDKPIFSIVNMVKPGTFNLDKMNSFTTPGLTLFMRLPGPSGGFAAFEAMLNFARILARNLNGDLKDEKRNILTTETIAHIKERILSFNRNRRSLGM